MPRLTKAVVDELAAPAQGNRVTYDTEISGFGVRVTVSGARSFVLNYRAGTRERRITIGAYPAWNVAAARGRAKELRQAVDRGEDPMGERHAERAAKTVDELADRYLSEYAKLRKRPRSVLEDVSILKQIIRPELGRMKVEAVRRADISALHRRLSEATPVRANRALSLLAKMFSLAVEWELRADNPCKGIEKNHENRRERFLTVAELGRLNAALAAHRDQATANALRLLILTGARRGEVLGAQWSQFDLDAAVWTKPASTTKQKKVHRVPLSGEAVALLRAMRARSNVEALFPGRATNAVQTDLKRSWASICKAAKLDGLRVHDLRHSYASFLASAGLSLPVIGALLGHSNPATTHRYAHLVDDALRAATERVGVLVSGATVRSA